MPKPVFIPKARRETILQQEQLAKEAEEREKRLEEELEARKKQSHDMLAEELKREREQGSSCSILFMEPPSDWHFSFSFTEGKERI